MNVIRSRCPISGARISMRVWSSAESAAIREAERASAARNAQGGFASLEEFIAVLRAGRASRREVRRRA